MGQNKITEKKKGAPKWATAPFKTFLKEVERLDQVLHLSIQGISMLRGLPKVVETLARVEENLDKDESKTKIERARKTAELARREIASNFPILHAQVVVNLWSHLEALIDSFLCVWIAKTPHALFVEPIEKLKVKIGDYERLDKSERISYLVELLERDLGAGLRNGVGRFEAVLKPFGFSGPVNESISKNIFELGQIRNALAHNAGIADKHLINSCPWLRLKIGRRVVISHGMFRRYMQGVHGYVTLLICRIGERYGVDMSDQKRGLTPSEPKGA